MIRYFAPAALALCVAPAFGQDRPPDADPLTVVLHTEDADRFARLFAETDGLPDAERLETEYLAPGSFGIEVFTPHRIKNADNLAAAIARDPTAYRKAIDSCLPAAKAAQSDLRSIYLGLQGALPTARLPQVYLVFGAGNSGGTARPGAQVLGLEVLCKVSDSPEALRSKLRHLFAHETIHSLQMDARIDAEANPLLLNVLAEGAADFIAWLVTGEEPSESRAAWAEPREAELWEAFQSDLALVENAAKTGEKVAEANAAAGRWVGNYGSAPDGWPSELGYWMGLRIWERYYEASGHKREALHRMLSIENPELILASGSYVP